MDVAAWLRGLGLEQYAQTFRDNAIDGDVLPRVTADDLKDMGVAVVGHRRKLLEAIAALDQHAEASPVLDQLDEIRPAPDPRRETVAPRGEASTTHGNVRRSCRFDGAVVSARSGGDERVATRLPECGGRRRGAFRWAHSQVPGDGVLCYFGWPRAHEDEAERAVRAGLAIVGAVGQLETPARSKLAGRIGVATGLVVVGDVIGEGGAQEEAVVGETPNLAARLQAQAQPGQVIVAESTRRLVGGLFEVEDLGPCPFRGFAQPVRAFRVLGPGRAEGRFESLHPEALTPLVGREQELALLLGRWRQAKDGEGQVVLLSGEPGIGKSRIVLALRERLREEPCTTLRYQCSPYQTKWVSLSFPQFGEIGGNAGFDDGVVGGRSEMATACWTRRWNRRPRACDRRRLKRKVNSVEVVVEMLVLDAALESPQQPPFEQGGDFVDAWHDLVRWFRAATYHRDLMAEAGGRQPGVASPAVGAELSAPGSTASCRKANRLSAETSLTRRRRMRPMPRPRCSAATATMALLSTLTAPLAFFRAAHIGFVGLDFAGKAVAAGPRPWPASSLCSQVQEVS